MISTSNIRVDFTGTPLFEDVNVKFLPSNCYGLIGANGAGKSTFLKVLSGELEPSAGHVHIPPSLRLATLEQDQFTYDQSTAMETVLQGHPRLFEVLKERETLYAKSDFSEEDGIRAADLEAAFADLNGYESEAEVGSLLAGLGINQALHDKRMEELTGGQKVRVLLAQALFGKPDILLLDEPTNHLDVHTVAWLEDYLGRLETLVIVVSHDRHFLNNVCTHIADIDFRQVRVYAGNYDFWLQASALAVAQRQNEQKRHADKAAELKTFIARFSSNASKARQATSRKKLLEKLTLDQLPVSTRKYPHIAFKSERTCGKSVLTVKGLAAAEDGEQLFADVSFTLTRGDRVAFVGPNSRAKAALFEILTGARKQDRGSFEWGTTLTTAYYPKENDKFFKNIDLDLIDWLRQFTQDQHEEYVRGFLGRMLFSGDDTLKRVKVLSGGERVRCMLSRMMQVGANALLLDEPTNHLDLESITALNRGLAAFDEENVILFSSHDRELVSTVANRIIEITPKGLIDCRLGFDDYIDDALVISDRERLYGCSMAL
ncbi:MAG: ATP-binding cassette domain-containing protein [Deltaproteobacteria bacterium]|nr:ATP-binding cassette domain-containing protein [Deltaproteobacteria bacterium]